MLFIKLELFAVIIKLGWVILEENISILHSAWNKIFSSYSWETKSFSRIWRENFLSIFPIAYIKFNRVSYIKKR